MSIGTTRGPLGLAEALKQSPQPLIRTLTVEENEKEVVIKGTVPSYYLKQLALETVHPLLGNRNLISDRLVVGSDSAEEFERLLASDRLVVGSDSAEELERLLAMSGTTDLKEAEQQAKDMAPKSFIPRFGKSRTAEGHTEDESDDESEELTDNYLRISVRAFVHSMLTIMATSLR